MARETISTATVYWGGRRRYLSIKGAASGAARHSLRQAIVKRGDAHMPDEWFTPRFARLRRLHEARLRRLARTPPHGEEGR